MNIWFLNWLWESATSKLGSKSLLHELPIIHVPLQGSISRAHYSQLRLQGRRFNRFQLAEFTSFGQSAFMETTPGSEIKTTWPEILLVWRPSCLPSNHSHDSVWSWPVLDQLPQRCPCREHPRSSLDQPEPSIWHNKGLHGFRPPLCSCFSILQNLYTTSIHSRSFSSSSSGLPLSWIQRPGHERQFEAHPVRRNLRLSIISAFSSSLGSRRGIV